MARYNDIDTKHWKEYSDILTDSLWIIDKRDNSGLHSGFYHGNFVPQIPNQLFRRYTKAGEWILDPFMGSGTSLIEARVLGRNSVGVELQQDVAKSVFERITQGGGDCVRYDNNDSEGSVFNATSEQGGGVKTIIKVGDSRFVDIASVLHGGGVSTVQFVILHPPYWDIIHFSKEAGDLSNCDTLASFLDGFTKVVDNTCACLDDGRYCAVVIGDKYANGEVVPLGFFCMDIFLRRGYVLKGIIVKNFGETKGKGANTSIWRYRALANDFYIFKHEYIFVFKKTGGQDR